MGTGEPSHSLLASRLTLHGLFLVLALLYLVSLTGCALPDSTQPVVKIGLIAPLEGWYRARGYDALWAVRLAIQEANRAGGVAGYQVELVALDDHLSPYWASHRARELVADPAVMGVVGGFSPAAVQAARPACSKAGLPLITTASMKAQGGIFVVAPPPDALARAAADRICQSQEEVRVVILYSERQEAWIEALQKRAEITEVKLDDSSWPDAVFRVHPDWVICTARTHLGGEVLRQARDEGLLFMGGPEFGTGCFRGMAGNAVEDTWFVTGAPRFEDLRDAPEFLSAYRELGGHKPGPDAMLAYDATRVLLAALAEDIQREGYPTRQGVWRSLAEVSISGVTGTISFDRSGARGQAPVWIYDVD
ncbi:MAG: branched-chain amino acid ABC transporter substrate-binding protein [Chloroflexota bacterium]|nr:branched-chain amino acid ABC transporter substrate-binding protein [Chloroflexota bacterium]